MEIPKYDDPSVFEKVREIVLMWMKPRAGVNLPDRALKGQSFSLDEDAAQPTEAVAVDEKEFRYWRARIRDGDKEVPGRTWITEIAIGEVGESAVTFCTRLRCLTRGEDKPFDPSIPSFVWKLIENQTAFLDSYTASTVPWFIDSQHEIDKLYKLLANPDRHSEVIVFSLLKDSTNQDETALLYRDVEDIAKKTAGAAHVVIMTGPASFWLSSRVGEEFSVFQQAVRTYRPGFDPDIDEPFRHPLVLQNTIHEQGDEWLKKLLISGALRGSIFHNKDIEQYLPPFTKIRSLANEKGRRIKSKLNRDTRTDDESSNAKLLKDIDQLKQENDQLKQDIDQLRRGHEKEQKELGELLDFAEDEREKAIQESGQFKYQNSSLKNYIKILEEKLKDSGYPIQPEIPTNLDNFENWCNEISDSVVVLNRAFRSVKESQYKDPLLIYEALLLLRNYYVPMRRESNNELRNELRKAYENKLKELGLSESPSITATRAGEENKTYLVSYAGRSELLDRHLTKGKGRNRKNCFRLYFFWDKDEKQVVVGSLPSHLDTRIT